MSSLPRGISGKETIKKLTKAGFAAVSQEGSHVKLKKGEIMVIVPLHSSLKPGTLRKIISQSGLTVEEFNIL